MSFKQEALGTTTKSTVLRVERDRIASFARATNDLDPEALAGTLAPPLFSVVPMYRPMGAAISSIVPAERMMYTLHGEQDMRFHQPIRPGTELHASATPVGFNAKSSGTTVSILGLVTDEHGTKVCEQWISVFIRGTGDTLTAGEPGPVLNRVDAAALGKPIAQKEQAVDADQTFRFAEASGDPMGVHLDDEIARKFGLPGIICHGLCTMAFAGNAAIEAVGSGQPQRLRRLAVRFAKPLFPGQQITTQLWAIPKQAGSFAFQTQAADGSKVLSNGLAEFDSEAR